MKIIILLLSLFTSLNVFACNDKMVDELVLDRLKMMAKRYDSTKVGTGVTILWGDTRVTSVAIYNGVGGSDGVRVDRMGTIFVNVDTCVVKAKLMGMTDIHELD